MVTCSHFRLKIPKILIYIFILLNITILHGMENLNTDLSLQEAYSLYQHDKIKIIDIRTLNEWNMTGVIPKSILINMHDENYQERSEFIMELKNILSKNNNNNVAIICASGARSKIVSDYLINEGYENIYNIPDGIIGKKSDGWLFQGLPLLEYKSLKEKE